MRCFLLPWAWTCTFFFPALAQRMNVWKWAFREPLLKVILCLSASTRKELWLRSWRWLQSCVSEQEGKDLSVGIFPGLIIGLYICKAEWCLSIRMMWFQFEALGFVTLGNGHLQSELPVPGFVFLAVWFSHFVQWVHSCICEGMHTGGSHFPWDLWRPCVCDLVWSLQTLWCWLQH